MHRPKDDGLLLQKTSTVSLEAYSDANWQDAQMIDVQPMLIVFSLVPT